jgi:hypothetical protein
MYFFWKNFWFTIHVDSWFEWIIDRICWACAVFRSIPNGMVQAWVAKKLINVTFYEFLRCPFFALGPRFHENRDILEVEVVHCNACIHQVLGFPLICHTPSKFVSHPAWSRHLRQLKLLNDSKFAALRRPLYNIGASAWPMAAFSGFYESHGPTPSGDALGIVPAHRHGHRNGQQSGHILHFRFVFCHPG